MPHLTASIIINSYNYGRFLAVAIDSALIQTYPHTEVIVVDDGSTDESLEVLNRYWNKVVPIVKDNGGQASALNRGFKESTGDVIYFLDSDDWLEPNAVEMSIGAFAGEGVAKVHWPVSIVDEMGIPTTAIEWQNLPSGDFRERAIRNGPANHTTPPTSANAWSRRALRRIMPIPERDFVISADAYLFALAPLYGTVQAIDVPLTRHRRHSLAASNQLTAAARVQLWETRARHLKRHLARKGIDASIDEWRRQNHYYRQLVGIQVVTDAVCSAVPVDSHLLVIAGGLFDPREIAPNRQATLLRIDRDAGGSFDDQAFAFVDRAMSREATFLALSGPLYRPRERLARFEQQMRASHRILIDLPEVIIFALSESIDSASFPTT